MTPHASPCMTCTDHSITCHGSCDPYKAYQQMRNDLRKRIVAANSATYVGYLRDKTSTNKGRPGKDGGIVGFANKQR